MRILLTGGGDEDHLPVEEGGGPDAVGGADPEADGRAVCGRIVRTG